MSSTEPTYTYGELKKFIAEYLGFVPSKSTLSGWMEAVLELPPPNPRNPRQYALSEAMALVLWARAGEMTKKGTRRTRAQRRNTLFLEAYRQ
jgi:hypothetical protein